MKKFAIVLAAVAALFSVLAAPLARADVLVHAWVSHTGGDISGCGTVGNPCATLAYAVTHSGAKEIGCLSSGSMGQFTISASVVIDCTGTVASTVASDGSANCGPAITINAPGAIVTLRSLDITALDACEGSGIVIMAASKVLIEDCKIENFLTNGISVATSANTVLNVFNTRIANSANGINFAPTGGAVNGSIDHSQIAQMSGDGITTNGGTVYFTVTNSLIVNAAGVGVNAPSGAVLEVSSSSVTNNRTGFATAGGVIRIARNVIYDNTTNFSIAGGIIATSGDNDVAVNGSTSPNGTLTRQ